MFLLPFINLKYNTGRNRITVPFVMYSILDKKVDKKISQRDIF